MAKGRCPNCGKETVEKFRPFCSKRCADIDLGRWLDGAYRVPTEEPADIDAPRPADEDDETR
jgi:endogenous inhibitor of DNA gyrase (YacG/DUF329 family)